MSSESNLIIGPYKIEATADVEIASQSSGVAIRSGTSLDPATSQGIELTSQTTASMMCGPTILAMETGTAAGKIVLSSGPPAVGPQITLGPGMIRISVGPPGAGASIELTPLSIVLQVAQVAYTLKPTGIEEKVGEMVTRQVTLAGHNLTAAQTELKVGVSGLNFDAPMMKGNVDGIVDFHAALVKIAVDGLMKVQAGISMNG